MTPRSAPTTRTSNRFDRSTHHTTPPGRSSPQATTKPRHASPRRPPSHARSTRTCTCSTTCSWTRQTATILLRHAPAVHLPNMESSSRVNHAQQHAVVPGLIGCCGRGATTSCPRGNDSLVYDKLRRLAAFHLSREDREHPFEPADLVSEVYLRLAGAQLEFTDQAHFFAIASRGMRQILVDHARKRLAAKRGFGDRPVEFDELRIPADWSQELILLAEALKELGSFDIRKACITGLHYFGGLTHGEIAAVCGIHPNTVARDLRLSEARLRGQFES
jgi:RNA polymerase sigma factor (TIGR02999 family)